MPDQPCLLNQKLDPAARADALEARRDDDRFVRDWPAGVASWSSSR